MMHMAPVSTSVEIWIIDCEQLLQLGPRKLARMITTYHNYQPWRTSILCEEIEHASCLRTFLQEWITQAATAPANEDRIVFLNALHQIFSLPGLRRIVAQAPGWDELPIWRTELCTMADIDEEPQIRALSLSVAMLMSLDPKTEHELILKGMGDRDSEVRATAVRHVRGLLRYPHKQYTYITPILNKLWELTKDPSPDVRLNCLQNSTH